MDMIETLATLSEFSAPSGLEYPLAEYAVGLLRQVLDDAWVTKSGNAVGVRRCGKPNAKRLLLDAHLDEIGLLITGAEEGFLRFRAVGGVDPRMLPDREVTILSTPPRFGLIACLPPHVQKAGAANKSIPIEDLYIDAGLTQAEAENLTGTFVVMRSKLRKLGDQMVSGKAMDDRSCFTALLWAAELLRNRPLDVDLYLMGSLREETSGEMGIVTGGYALQPTCCVVVDVTHGRTPDGPKEQTYLTGQGPAIGIGPNLTRWMTQRLIQKAEDLSLPWQAEVMGGNTYTNAWKMQISREGVATALVSLPLKYMHSPVETLHLDDLENTARLLAAFVENFDQEGGPYLAD